MFTYRFLSRQFRFLDNLDKIKYPEDVLLEFYLNPKGQFDGTGTYRNALSSECEKAEMDINSFTGRRTTKSSSPLRPIQLKVNTEKINFELKGNIIKSSKRCIDFDDVNNFISSIYYVIPVVLNIVFPDPPFITETNGRIGNIRFNWLLKEVGGPIAAVNTEQLETHAKELLKTFDTFLINNNRRLLAALYYFYTARRLLYAENTRFEFMAEYVLNLSKCLESLFVTSDSTYNDVRRELKALGYTSAQIESTFIPIMIVRNQIDVGHITLSIREEATLNELYEHLHYAQIQIEYLLKIVTEKVIQKSYTLPKANISSEREDALKKVLESFRNQADDIPKVRICLQDTTN